jgi:hypothetical protein
MKANPGGPEMSGQLEYAAMMARNQDLLAAAGRNARQAPFGRIERKPRRRPVLRSRPGRVVRGRRG